VIELSDKDLEHWKDVFAKDGIVYETDDDYKEAVHNLVGFFDVLIEIDQRNKRSEVDSD
jgi:threonine dehydrogenase-like Zn-dependent dehydrogenase